MIYNPYHDGWTSKSSSKYMEKLRGATGKITCNLKPKRQKETDGKKTINDASLKREIRGWDYQIRGFVLVSDFEGQGVG